MLKRFMLFVLGMTLMGITGCNIKTPEIIGVVLDEETKQPVEGAWVRATLEIKSKTIQGDVHPVLSVEKPHTRTNKEGSFVIPAKSFKKPLPPVGFGTEVESFDINAKTIDRIGGIQVELRDLSKKKIEVRIYIRSIEKIYEEAFQKYLREGITKERASELIEGDYFSSLQSLYRYCLTGRSSVEVPPVEGGCDEWELNYAIAKHERYLNKYKDPKTIVNPPYGVSKFEKIIHYSGVIQQLAYLYKKRGDNNQALKLFKEVKDFDKKHELSLHLKEYEYQIDEIQKLIREKQK